MAGLDLNGFTPLTFSEIKQNIETRLEQYNPGFDFSDESPDGQLINIMTVLINQVWIELNRVYHSYNPNIVSGQGLRNIGMITGLYKGAATRSLATVSLIGTGNTLVPKGSIFSDDDGNEFYTNKDAFIPASVTVLSVLSGPVPVLAGSIKNLVSQVLGLSSVDQPSDGIQGSNPQSEIAYRNLRNKTVMRGSNTVQESMEAKIRELGIQQVTVTNNDTESTAPDNTPPHSIQVVVGEFSGVSDMEIASAVLSSKGLGVPTYGTTTVTVKDIHDNDHDINFTKATEIPIFINADITLHTIETAGVKEAIEQSLTDHINFLLAGEDVVWSRLFANITPFGNSEVTSLEIGKSAGVTSPSNVVIGDGEFASNIIADINLTIT